MSVATADSEQRYLLAVSFFLGRSPYGQHGRLLDLLTIVSKQELLLCRPQNAESRLFAFH